MFWSCSRVRLIVLENNVRWWLFIFIITYLPCKVLRFVGHDDEESMEFINAEKKYQKYSTAQLAILQKDD